MNMLKVLRIIAATSLAVVVLTMPVLAGPRTVSVEQSFVGGNGYETQGVKGAIVKAAVKKIAKALRYGGPILNKLLRYLDPKAASILSKYASRLADKLDYIATIPDLTANMVKDYVFNFLVNDLKVKGGSALVIADAIKAVVNWLIF